MSHNGMVAIKDQNLVELCSMLSSTECANDSHGFILLKYDLRKQLFPVSDNINATANIYFDFNPPITANTAAVSVC
jgi:hypothetical protein